VIFSGDSSLLLSGLEGRHHVLLQYCVENQDENREPRRRTFIHQPDNGDVIISGQARSFQKGESAVASLPISHRQVQVPPTRIAGTRHRGRASNRSLGTPARGRGAMPLSAHRAQRGRVATDRATCPILAHPSTVGQGPLRGHDAKL
jgi:hypothetical protein